MDQRTRTPRSATLAGLEGQIVGVAGSWVQWEVEVPTADLPSFLARFTSGEALQVATEHGLLTVKARDWVVWPGDKTMKLRVALEDAGTW